MSTINIDDIVYTVKGKNAKALAVVEDIKHGDVRVGRFGTKPINSKTTYIARYADGTTLRFNSGAINHSVFKLEDDE